MLILRDINPTGYFSYGMHETVYLDGLGLVLLEGKNNDRTGNPNGAGKTSLFNALTSILFDKNPIGESGEAIVNEKLGKSFGKVGFLDSNGVKWRVIVTRKWRKTDKYPDPEFSEPSEWLNHGEKYSGTDVYLERWDDAKNLWIDERGTNQAGDSRLELKATRQKLITVLGLNYDQFMSVGYLAQQQSMRFINGTHKERMQVIAELGDIGTWDKRRDKIKDRLKMVESEIDRLKATIVGANKAGHLIAEPKVSDKELYEQSILDANKKAQECLDAITLISANKAAWVSAHTAFDSSIKTKMEEQRALVVQKQSITESINKCVRDQSEEYRKLISKPKDSAISNLESQVKEIKGVIMTRRFDLEQMLPGAGKCTRCRSVVSDDHLLRQKELLLLEIKELEEKILNLNIEVKAANDAWEVTSQKDLNDLGAKFTSTRSDLDVMSGMMDASIRNIDDAIAEISRKKAELGKDPELQISSYSVTRMGHLATVSQAQERIKEWDKRLDAWTEYNNILETARTSISTLEDELKYLRVVERMFGDKGIKAHRLGIVLSQLNHLVQKFLDILTDGAVQVWVTPFREKSDGGLSADVQIMVREGEKSGVPFDLYSGGEKQQIVLAFIGAFWQVASLQGSGVNILCLDEIFGPLDDQNAIGVYNYLDYIRSQGKSSVIVVTHSSEVKNQLKFNKMWVVEKTNHMSVLRT